MSDGATRPDPGRNLAAAFLEARGEVVEGGVAAEALERALHEVWARGRAAWPNVPLAAEVLAQHLAVVVPREVDAAAAVREVDAGGLYVACACLHRVPQAMSAFEEEFMAETGSFIARLSLSTAQVEEVKQALREKLLMAAPGGVPKLARYSGRSPLGSWLRVVALRTALNMQRGKPRWTGEAGLDALAAGADLELSHIRARYQEEFSRALRDAFAELTSKQRNLLRLRFMEGLTDAKIGRLFGVHQTTATRWIGAAREAVFAETKRLLRERLRLSTGEFESLIAAVQSQLDVSITGLLRTGKG